MSSNAVERLLCRGGPDHGVAKGRRARPGLAHLCAWRGGSASNRSSERGDHDQRHKVRVSPRDSVHRGRDAVAQLVQQARHDDCVAPQPPATADMFQTDWRYGLGNWHPGCSIGSGAGSTGSMAPAVALGYIRRDHTFSAPSLIRVRILAAAVAENPPLSSAEPVFQFVVALGRGIRRRRPCSFALCDSGRFGFLLLSRVRTVIHRTTIGFSYRFVEEGAELVSGVGLHIADDHFALGEENLAPTLLAGPLVPI